MNNIRLSGWGHLRALQLLSNKRRARQRQGAMAILICVMLFAFLCLVALSVDISYMNLVKTELRSATDAAAKAASETLARTQDPQLAIARGIEIANRNLVANQQLHLTEDDFQFGRSDLSPSGSFVFSTGVSPTNSVRVTGKRTADSYSGGVGLFFGRMMGKEYFEPSETCTSTYIQRDIVLVLDRSGSMLQFNKSVDLQNAVRIFLDIMDGSPVEERIGLATYATSASQDVQMTEDLQLIRNRMSTIRFDGTTNISGGIDAGRSIITRGRNRDFVEKTMIVLTDGLQNAGRAARLAARDAAAEGITIHAITFGRDADRATMDEVATIGRGRYFHATTGAELENVFREIALTLASIITE